MSTSLSKLGVSRTRVSLATSSTLSSSILALAATRFVYKVATRGFVMLLIGRVLGSRF